MLRYFNEKANILSEISEQQRYLYSIAPLCSAEKVLERSTDTRDTDDMKEEIEMMDY